MVKQRIPFGVIALSALALAACRPGTGDEPTPSEEPSDEEPSDGDRTDDQNPDDLPETWWDESEEALERTQDLLGEMTLREKVDMLHGEQNNFFGFYNAPIESLGIPALTMADGPIGVRIADPDVNEQQATQLPSGLALAATWDPDLARQHGALAGEEAFETNHNVLLAPVVDIVRTPQWGRAFEAFGEDPLLNGLIGAASIRGIQSRPVMSGLKHYLVYTQETNRLAGGNVVIDERALQEIYVRPFAIAQRYGRPGAMMCAFNQVNGVYACENERILDDVLKRQLGFEGFMMSDYGATQSTIPSILAGLDMEQPGDTSPDEDPDGEGEGCFFCDPLVEAVEEGTVPMRRIDDAVTRILRPMFGLGLFDEQPSVEPLPEAEHGAEARAIAEQGIVLLKNDEGALPLDAGELSSIAVLGADADVIVSGGGSAQVIPTYTVSPLEAIRSRVGEDVEVEHLPGTDPVTSAALLPGPAPIPSGFTTPPDGEGDGLRAQYYLNRDFSGEPELDRVEPYAALNGGFFIFEGFNAASPHFPEQPQALNTAISVRWTGQLTVPQTGTYELALTSNGTGRLYLDDELVLSTDTDELDTTTTSVELEAGEARNVRVEFVTNAPEGTDAGPRFKLGWVPPEGVVAPRIEEAAELARNSDVAIVVARDYTSEGGDLPSLDLPNNQAELIRQVAEANPRTIVVLTVGGAIQTSDWDDEVPAVLHAWYGGQEQGNAIARVLFGDVNPSGRLPITMPVDEASTPVSDPEQFPGDGLDQRFTEGIFVGYRGYEELGITPQYAFGHGLSYTTFEYDDLRIEPVPADADEEATFRVALDVQNTGDVTGTETVQVYVGALPAPVESPSKALAGWAKVTLEPGETEEVTIELSPGSLAYWDVDENRWVTPRGDFPILVGASAADIRLTGTGTLNEP